MEILVMAPKRAISVSLHGKDYLIDESTILVGMKEKKATYGWRMTLFNEEANGLEVWVSARLYQALGEISEFRSEKSGSGS